MTQDLFCEFPTTPEAIPAWIRKHEKTLSEGKRRFAQYAVCCAVVAADLLREHLVFKGGNALLFAYGSVRSTIDLDFSSSDSPENLRLPRFKEELGRSLSKISRKLSLALRIQSSRKNPKKDSSSTPTYLIKVAYALPGDKIFERWNLLKGKVPNVIELEVALNEKICSFSTPFEDPNLQGLKVSDVEDIVAEKLRAMLQQVTRNRMRPQDVFDVAAILKMDLRLEEKKVSAFLKQKAKARNIVPSLTAFRDPRVWKRAASDYEALAPTVPGPFIEFKAAKSTVLQFIKKLDLPPDGPSLRERIKKKEG